MKCGTVICQGTASIRMFWPGQTLDVCMPCVGRALEIADAMGFELATEDLAPPSDDWTCGDCGELNPSSSGQCKRCGVKIGPGPLEPAPVPTNASISVDVAEVAGVRVVKLVLPAGAQSIAVALPPDTAEALARTLAQQARIARSPAGLILPRS